MGGRQTEQENTALIVIDMQADYIGNKCRHHDYPVELTDKINERIAVAVKQDELVIYVKNISRRKGEPYTSAFVEDLSVASDFIIEKRKASMFDHASLLDMLRQSQISHLELIGRYGNCCVAVSAIDASKLGFTVTFPLDCIGIKDKGRFDRTMAKLMRTNVEVVEMREIVTLPQ